MEKLPQASCSQRVWPARLMRWALVPIQRTLFNEPIPGSVRAPRLQLSRRRPRHNEGRSAHAHPASDVSSLGPELVEEELRAAFRVQASHEGILPPAMLLPRESPVDRSCEEQHLPVKEDARGDSPPRNRRSVRKRRRRLRSIAGGHLRGREPLGGFVDDRSGRLSFVGFRCLRRGVVVQYRRRSTTGAQQESHCCRDRSLFRHSSSA